MRRIIGLSAAVHARVRGTPVRDFWPLTPRPEVLPLPEPGPRPTRRRFLCAPSLSRISLSLVMCLLLGVCAQETRTRLISSAEAVSLAHHLDQVRDLSDHAADGRVILQG